MITILMANALLVAIMMVKHAINVHLAIIAPVTI